MARSLLTDILQVFPFWLSDVAPIDGLATPMLTPLFGFSAITAPEITADFQEITEGNWYFKKKVIKGGDVSNITLQRGATFYDSDFWKWMIYALSGKGQTDITIPAFGPFAPAALPIASLTPRRQLVLTQYLVRPSLSGVGGAIAAGLIGGAVAAAGGGLSGGAPGPSAVVGAAATAALGALHFGPFEFQARIPAKAWILHGCLPARYKAAGDFDASSSAISIQELELSIEMMEEVALSA